MHINEGKGKIALFTLQTMFVHFIHEIKTKGYDVIVVNLFLRPLMRFLRKKGDNFIPPILLT